MPLKHKTVHQPRFDAQDALPPSLKEAIEAFAAATRNRAGMGAAYYVGTVVAEAAFYDSLVGEVLAAAGVALGLDDLSGDEPLEDRAKEGASSKLCLGFDSEQVAGQPRVGDVELG